MEILEAKEDLFHDDLDQSNRDAGFVVSFDERQEVFPEWLKNDANVDILGRTMVK